MVDYTNLHHDREQEHDRDREEEEEEEEEDEEALSLCDLPLQGRNKEGTNIATQNSARPSSEPAEFFEFLSDLGSDQMSSAEDIIFHGKLVPFIDPYFTPQNQTKEDKQRISFRRRCESLSELQSSASRSNSTKNNIALMRNSRSLDYRNLERFSSSKRFSPELDIERSSSLKSIHTKGEVKRTTSSKPRWYLLMFGVVRPPTEMDLSDIKSRQVRRNSSMTMFPHVDTDGKKAPVSQSSISKGSCKLLRVLSCKDPASVAVATSFLSPQV